VDECKKFFPSSETGWLFPRIVVDEAKSSVSAYTTFGALIGSKAVATFDKSKPHLGCKMTKRALPLTKQEIESLASEFKGVGQSRQQIDSTNKIQ
jgi:hypothetical protein